VRLGLEQPYHLGQIVRLLEQRVRGRPDHAKREGEELRQLAQITPQHRGAAVARRLLIVLEARVPM
jgi:hypothetical protein